MNKLSIFSFYLLITMMALSTTATAGADEPVSKAPIAVSIPDLDRIKADVSGQFLYSNDGLPSIGNFHSKPSTSNVHITSSVREEDLLKLNVTVLLTDGQATGNQNSMVKSSLTYQENGNGWKLLNVENNHISDTGLTYQINTGDDC